MNPPLNFREAKIRNSESARRLSLKLATGLACLCLGAGLLLPVIRSRAANHHAMPPGQLQADLRTFAAEVRYLLAPEPVIERHPAPFASGLEPVNDPRAT